MKQTHVNVILLFTNITLISSLGCGPGVTKGIEVKESPAVAPSAIEKQKRDNGAENITKKVDQIFEAVIPPDSPGVSLGIIKDGELIYTRGYGLANLEHGIPITSQTVFRVASMSKQFTAMCILLLVEQGKLSLDDDIRKFLPEMPEYKKPITIRHLVHHTSGIYSHIILVWLAGIFPPSGPYYFLDSQAYRVLARQKQLNFEPGEEHSYNNVNYFLLSLIIKKVSGKSLRQYAHEHIFEPLGMRNTHFHDDLTMVVKNRATGYMPKKGDGFTIGLSEGLQTGGGGLFTTVEDLAKWDANFYQNALGADTQMLIEKMLTTGKLNNGEDTNYAFGLKIGDQYGLTTVRHAGFNQGYQAEILRFPEKRFSVIGLANTWHIQIPKLNDQVAALYLEKEEKNKGRDTSQQNGIQKKLDQFSLDRLQDIKGTYYCAEKDGYCAKEGYYLELSFKDGQLLVKPMYRWSFSVTPLSQYEFTSKDAPWGITTITFQPRKDKESPKLTLQRKDNPARHYELIDEVSLTVDQLKAYTGEYYASALDTTYNLELKGDKLFVMVNEVVDLGDPPEPLVPKQKDYFFAYEMSFNFSRNKKGVIDGFILSTPKVRAIRFEKRRKN